MTSAPEKPQWQIDANTGKLGWYDRLEGVFRTFDEETLDFNVSATRRETLRSQTIPIGMTTPQSPGSIDNGAGVSPTRQMARTEGSTLASHISPLQRTTAFAAPSPSRGKSYGRPGHARHSAQDSTPSVTSRAHGKRFSEPPPQCKNSRLLQALHG